MQFDVASFWKDTQVTPLNIKQKQAAEDFLSETGFGIYVNQT